MLEIKRFFIILIFLAGVTTNVGAVFLETTPSSMELDQVERGESYEKSIYLNVDQVAENQSVTLDTTPISYDNTRLFESSLDEEDKSRVSEQGTEGWWTIESTEINPSNQISPESSPESFDGRMDVEIEVPADADPGIRYGQIRMTPSVDEEAGGVAGSTIQGGVNLRYLINVEGPVERNINLEDVRGFRPSENEASVELLLVNEGNVKTSTESFQIDVYDGTGDVLDTLSASSVELEPGETEWVSANWEGEEVEEGDYQVDGEINYFTGEAYASGSFDLGDIISVEDAPTDSPVTPDEEGSDLPPWLAFMILVVLGVLMWSFEIDPVWIFGIIGILAFSTFILLSSLNNLMIGAVLIPIIILIYTGV